MRYHFVNVAIECFICDFWGFSIELASQIMLSHNDIINLPDFRELRMLTKQWIACLSLIAATGVASASQSIIDTYKQALSNDTGLEITRLQQQIAEANVDSGLARLLPSVSASAGYGVGSESGKDALLPDFEAQSVNASISLQQTIFSLAAFSAYDALKVNASAADISTKIKEQQLIVDVAQNYVSVMRAQDALAVAKAQVEAVERQYDQTNQRYEVGLVTITDVLDASATLDQSKVALIRTQAQYDIAMQTVSIATGESFSGAMDLSDDLPIQAPALEGMQDWIDFAKENHPTILKAKKDLESGQLALNATKQNRLPTVTGSISVKYNDSFGDKIPTDYGDETHWSASYGVNISVPLYTGGATEADIAIKGINNNIAEQALIAQQRAKQVMVGNYYRTVRADAQNVEAQRQALKSRESALKATTVGYDVGTRNIVEVLNAQVAVFSAQNALNNSRYDYVLNLLRLKNEAGQLSVKDLEQIEQYLVE
ncbi:TolC family outer membrane protein [Reinekea sp.]|jgi:outer membrane protein|uniref:TolC family outer membrane protein n=1 Tax=Reinekea sp. TaxID=1970455 RepID=UPI003989AB38